MLNWMKKAAVAAAIAIASSTIVAPPAGAIAGGRVNNADSLALLILGGSQCSGTVIAPEWVVTAKHCVHQGNSAIFIKKENYYPKEAVLHPKNDLALIRLDRPTSATPTPLATSHLQPQERATVAGWGGDELTGALMADAVVQRRGHNLPGPPAGGEGVVDGEEDVPVVRIHMDLGLEHPGMDRNAAGSDLVVAQGELDEVAAPRPAGR